MKKYSIEKWRVVYVKSAKHFWGESPWMYTDFLARKRVPKSMLILHDTFKVGQESIFDTLGYSKHVVYPPSVHQYLLPNDNSLHGVKAKWHSEYYKFKSDVEASFRLMQLLDLDTVKNSKYYFERNLFKLTEATVAELIKD